MRRHNSPQAPLEALSNPIANWLGRRCFSHRDVCNFPRQYVQALFSSSLPSRLSRRGPRPSQPPAVTSFDAGIRKRTPALNDAREFRGPPLREPLCFLGFIALPHDRSDVEKNVAAAS
ncbi:MAG TPA: hypothetical protein VEN79_04235 [Terriglobia bacterium]|nr:hypothetical protein [Terriglobia bacterium]